MRRMQILRNHLKKAKQEIFSLFCILLILLISSNHSYALPTSEIKLTDRSFVNIGLPVPVLHVQGDLSDEFKAHAKLIEKYPQAVVNLKHFSQMIEHNVANGGFFRKNPILKKPLSSLINFILRLSFISPMQDMLPEEYEKGYLELAKAAGMSEHEIMNALMVPDQVMWLMSILRNHKDVLNLPNNFGCTSIIWNQNHESVLHGRNLDYDVSGVWDLKPLILHVIPKNGIAFVAITAMGIHAPGITAFNEAGLTLAIHQLGVNDTSNSGVAMPVISSEIIRHAKNIDDVIKMLQSYPRSGTWAYVVSDGLDRAVIETSANTLEVRRSSEKFFYQTNHVSGSELENKQFAYSIGTYLDSFDRAERLQQLKKKYKNQNASPKSVISVISDTNDRIAGGTIAKLDNIQSVVMNPSKKSVWIAISDADRSPNENKYFEFNWKDLRSPHSPLILNTINLSKPSAARIALHRAANRSENDLKSITSIRSKELSKVDVASINKKQKGLWAFHFLSIVNGLQEISFLDDKNSEVQKNIIKPKLLSLLKQSEDSLSDPLLAEYSLTTRHRKSLILLFKARILDLLDRHDEAKHMYHFSEQISAFPQIYKITSESYDNPYTFSDLKSLSVDWIGIDLFHY